MVLDRNLYNRKKTLISIETFTTILLNIYPKHFKDVIKEVTKSCYYNLNRQIRIRWPNKTLIQQLLQTDKVLILDTIESKLKQQQTIQIKDYNTSTP